MASTVWKGHLTFGLVSIPVKIYRAARAETVSFRQIHSGTGARVRQTLVADAPPEEETKVSAVNRPEPLQMPGRNAPELVRAPVRSETSPIRSEPRPEEAVPVQRSEIVKGYEYARDQFVTLSKEELAKIAPETAREMQIVEFVRLAEVDPIYFETSYYVAPDKGGERAYTLLLEALRQSGLVGLAQMAMHNREHVVVIRPGRHGVVLHTMFYESEIRQNDEYRTAAAAANPKELDLALLLVRNLEAPFEPAKYRDSYREKLDALIQAKIAGAETIETPAPKHAPVVNILEALQRSLESAAGRKPPAKEEKPEAPPKAQRKRSVAKG